MALQAKADRKSRTEFLHTVFSLTIKVCISYSKLDLQDYSFLVLECHSLISPNLSGQKARLLTDDREGLRMNSEPLRRT